MSSAAFPFTVLVAGLLRSLGGFGSWACRIISQQSALCLACALCASRLLHLHTLLALWALSHLGQLMSAWIWPAYCCSRVLKPGFWLSQVVLSEQPELNASDPKVLYPLHVLVYLRCKSCIC